LTKADKLNRNERVATARAVQQGLPNCTIELFSALSRLGVDSAQRWVQHIFSPKPVQ
jgi:GTP-binding protein EngB required for normal cell division